MLSKGIQDLFNEHGGIITMLEILDAVCRQIKSGKNLNSKDLENIVEFISNFADKCHHGKEEGILIPEMKKSPKSDIRLINEILGEHKSGRDFVRGMRESLTGMQTGNPETFHFRANAEAYINLLMTHIRKENVILFPRADELFDDRQQDQIWSRFEILEKNVIGPGKHEEYHSLLNELKAKYL